MARAAEVYTYRCYRHRRPQEIHFNGLLEALERAMEDMETYAAMPVQIRLGKTVVMNERDITDAWETKYLKGEKPTL